MGNWVLRMKRGGDMDCRASRNIAFISCSEIAKSVLGIDIILEYHQDLNEGERLISNLVCFKRMHL